jgi:periplasmic copper chaperone A
MRISTLLGALVLVGAVTNGAMSHEYKTATFVIHHPWSRATPATAKVAAGYATIENVGRDPDRLVGGSLQVATGFEIHDMAVVDGVMTMRPMEGGLEIGPGKTVKLEPNGAHLMFPGLQRPLKQGERVAGTLVFEKAGTIKVDFAVDSIAAKGEDHVHTQ